MVGSGRYSTESVIAALVHAVRAGDDAGISGLLGKLAELADLDALFALRDALGLDLELRHGGGGGTH